MKSTKSILCTLMFLVSCHVHATECKVDIDRAQDSASDANSSDTNSTSVDRLIVLAKSKIGNSYQTGATGPDHFDCSGFVYYLFGQNGVSIPRTSLAQSKSGEKLTRTQIKRGDILFFDTYERGHINHSGVYLGDGKFIHASSGKAYGVTISELDRGYYVDKFRWGIHK